MTHPGPRERAAPMEPSENLVLDVRVQEDLNAADARERRQGWTRERRYGVGGLGSRIATPHGCATRLSERATP